MKHRNLWNSSNRTPGKNDFLASRYEAPRGREKRRRSCYALATCTSFVRHPRDASRKRPGNLSRWRSLGDGLSGVTKGVVPDFRHLRTKVPDFREMCAKGAGLPRNACAPHAYDANQAPGRLSQLCPVPFWDKRSRAIRYHVWERSRTEREPHARGLRQGSQARPQAG